MKYVNESSKEVLDKLKQLTEEVGAFAIRNWRYKDKLSLQCEEDKLVDFLDKKRLYFNAEDSDGTPAYETDSLFLYYAPSKEEN